MGISKCSTLSVEQNVKLSDFSNYKTGGPAGYFAVVKNAADIKSALLFAQESNLKAFILAGGTNVLFPDEGFCGLVIKIGLDNFRVDGSRIIAGAGVLVSDLVKASIDKELTGLDWAGGLPGTIGGAVRGNAGCFGGEMKDIVESVKAIDFNGELKTFSNKDCGFGYRHSRFKKEKLVITEVVLNLRRDLSRQKIAEIVQSHIDYRRACQPLDYPNCGSVFKNVPVEKVTVGVAEKFKDVIKTDPFPVIPTAALIHEAGLKGYVIGGAKVSEKHPNFIINFDNAKSKDIADLISFVKKEIKLKFQIDLEPEVETVVNVRY